MESKNPVMESRAQIFTESFLRLRFVVGKTKHYLLYNIVLIIEGIPRWYRVKNPLANAADLGFHPWVGKTTWRRKWQPFPVFLPGKISWTEKPGGLQCMGLQRVGHNLATEHAGTIDN